MQKELTISLEEKTYNSLIKLVGKENTSQFIEQILLPHVSDNLEEYEVKIPLTKGEKTVYLRSPRFKNLPKNLKMELVEETVNA
jgi:hypothetical protein